MNARPDIICIGSVLWDVIGRAPGAVAPGWDVPGTITRLPGGVAMNIAMTLRRHGLQPTLLSAVGRDPQGDALVVAAEAMGIATGHLFRPTDLPTDSYMAIEDARGLIAAVADAHTLESAGAQILAPLADGRLGSAAAPWAGPVALDGNLTEALLAEIAASPFFAAADLRVAPASPGKATRLLALLTHPRATLYLNRQEAGLLCATTFASAAEAAAALIARGARHVLVTDGDGPVTAANGATLITRTPPGVTQARVTGAGDTFMAAHIAAERRGLPPDAALEAALTAAAAYVAGKDHG